MKKSESVFEMLLSRFNLSNDEWELFIKTAPYRYKEYDIPKRNGGLRTIAQPSRALKIVQIYLIENLLKNLPIHDCATAYKKNTSIKNHAAVHADNMFLLKLDFKNFFPSLDEDDFKLHCRKYMNRLSSVDIDVLVRLLFWAQTRTHRKLVLSIGAPSSPKLSNSLLYDFDVQLSDFCKILNVTYTRYADDLAFSCNTPNTLIKIQTEVKRICNTIVYPKKIMINDKKTVHASKKEKRFLTGLVLSNDGLVSLGRDKKREVRARACSFAKSPSSFEDTERNKLKGYLLFAMSIDKSFVSTIEQMMNRIDKMSYSILMK